MQPRAVRRLDEDFLRRGKPARNLRAARLVDALGEEDQAALQEIEDQRQANRDRDDDLDEGRDQVFWYSSAPLRTNSIDFSSMPFST